MIFVLLENLWSDVNSEMCHAANSSKQPIPLNVAGNNDTLGTDHEYHEISDEENQDSPLRFDKTLNFDFGPSLLAEMDQMFRSLGIRFSKCIFRWSTTRGSF